MPARRRRRSALLGGPLGNRAVEPEEHAAEPAPGPEARREQVRLPPVRDHRRVVLLGRPREAGIGERNADPRASRLGQRDGEADEGSRSGRARPVVLARALDRDVRTSRQRAGRRDSRSARASSSSANVSSHSCRSSSSVGTGRSGEDRRLCLVLRQSEADLDQGLDLALLAGGGSRIRRALRPRSGREPPGCRAPAGLPKPTRNHASTSASSAGTSDVVPRSTLLDPVSGCGRVQVARILGLLDGVPCGLDPDVRSPGVVARRAEQVPDDAAVPERDGSGGRRRGPRGPRPRRGSRPAPAAAARPRGDARGAPREASRHRRGVPRRRAEFRLRHRSSGRYR